MKTFPTVLYVIYVILLYMYILYMVCPVSRITCSCLCLYNTITVSGLHLVGVRGFELSLRSGLLLPPVSARLPVLPLSPPPLLLHLHLQVLQVAPPVLLPSPPPLLTFTAAEDRLVSRLGLRGSRALEGVLEGILVRG